MLKHLIAARRRDLRASMPLAARRRRSTRPNRSACWSALPPAAARTPPPARWRGKLCERLGQQVIIDNRPGAAGNIATEITAKATPDGYTILMGTIAALAINPSLYKKLPFDPLKDVLPISQAVDSTNILVVHPSVPAKNVKELIALAKTKSLNGGSSGIGGAGHLALELFNLQAGTKIVHVAVQGRRPGDGRSASAARSSSIFATAASAVPHIKSGRIRALAVTTAKRSALVPELPTIAEAGLPGFRRQQLVRRAGPGQDPAPDHQPPEQGSRRRAQHARRQGDPVQARASMPRRARRKSSAPTSNREKEKWEKVIKAAKLYQTN